MSEETAESRLKETLFVVEASSFEQQCLWQDFSKESSTKKYKNVHVSWQQINPGWLITVGCLDGNTHRPVCISTSWAKINDKLVMFWHPTSNIVDHAMIDAWLKSNFTGTWDNGSRRATTNAMNFHHCLDAVKTKRGLHE